MVLPWTGRRYYSWNKLLLSVFGEKVAKIPLDAGLSCPNRAGGAPGCIYCSPRGSGDLAGEVGLDLSRQFARNRARAREKWPQVQKFIAYFQAYTNTLAPVDKLKDLYGQALAQEGVVGLSISTRPDCLPPAVLDLLTAINRRTWLWLELGLQSIHDVTLSRINRGHDSACFIRAAGALRARGIRVCAHIILGLPGETEAMMLDTARALAGLGLDGIKIHLLTVLKDTPLALLWENGLVPLPDLETYAGWVADVLEVLPPQMVIQRLTGDAPAPQLLAPAWSLRKWETLMAIENELARRDSWQGKKWGAPEKSSMEKERYS